MEDAYKLADELHITEEPSKDRTGNAGTIFYIREKPYRPGYSYQSTALTRDAAEREVLKLGRRIAQ